MGSTSFIQLCCQRFFKTPNKTEVLNLPVWLSQIQEVSHCEFYFNMDFYFLYCNGFPFIQVKAIWEKIVFPLDCSITNTRLQHESWSVCGLSNSVWEILEIL